MRYLSLFLLLLAGPAFAQPASTDQRTITVTGEGRSSLPPDQALARFSIVTSSQDPESGRQANAETASTVLNALRELGIADADLRLEQLRLGPKREYDAAKQQWNDVGFETTRTLVVTVRDIDDLPGAVASVVSNGGNRLEGVRYVLDNPAQGQAVALIEAVADARAKAELMAGALGAEVGVALTVREGTVATPRPQTVLEARALSDASAVPEAYAPGQLDVRASVTVTFALR
ncbi:MAG: SIMPL domain-containing protein [Bacteroidota bacterium]